jgi:hypothetical protein
MNLLWGKACLCYKVLLFSGVASGDPKLSYDSLLFGMTYDLKFLATAEEISPDIFLLFSIITGEATPIMCLRGLKTPLLWP